VLIVCYIKVGIACAFRKRFKTTFAIHWAFRLPSNLDRHGEVAVLLQDEFELYELKAKDYAILLAVNHKEKPRNLVRCASA